MRNSRLLPYETIIQATTGEPEAVNAVLQDYITQTLLAAIFKFRFTTE